MAKKTSDSVKQKIATIDAMLKIVDLAFIDPEEYDAFRKDIAILGDFIGTQAVRSKPIPKPLQDQISLIGQIKIAIEQKEDANQIKDLLIRLRNACGKEGK